MVQHPIVWSVSHFILSSEFLTYFVVFTGLSVSTFTCGPVVLVVSIFQALVYVIFRRRPFRRLTDSLILAIAYTFRTWASYLKGEVEPVRPFSPIAAQARSIFDRKAFTT